MAKALYLEHYLDSIEGLPFELQRNFSLMTDLDNRTEEKKLEIERLVCEYMDKVRKFSPEGRMEHLKKIDEAYSKCKAFSDDKVQLALQIYELVDKHIRRLDAELARFENELKDKTESGWLESNNDINSKKKKSLKEKRGGCRDTGSDLDFSKQKSHSDLLDVHGSDVLDMPVDPNEPTYCVCSQVSYGEMIGCDNADCPTEWFHFACVGLTTKPKGKWFCPQCSRDIKKK